ncbi:MAG: cytochrome b/b6 domain-containing protein [Pseudomonadota bacterium]
MNERCYRVWDFPVRAFHWLLLAAVLTAIVSANTNQMDLHLWAGHSILGLLIFRLLWGFLGSPTARFGHFVRSPLATLRYLREARRQPATLHIGHNPLGAWSVLALLTLLAIQVGTGLFADDEILTQGPLARHIDEGLRQTLTGLHKLNIAVLVGFIGLHVLAIALYKIIRKQDLLGPMIIGTACVPADTPVDGAENGPTPWGRFLLALAIAIGVTAGVWLH